MGLNNLTNNKADYFQQLDGFTPRVEKIKAQYLDARPSIAINRAKAFTEVYRDNPGMPAVLLRAKAFRRACELAPVAIFDDELIVSHPAGKRRAGEIAPDIAWRWIRNELHTVSTREQDPYDLSAEDIATLEADIFPFWQGRSVDEIAETQLREAGLWDWSIVCDLSIKTQNGGGDTCPGYDNLLLVKGFGGIKAEAQAHLSQLSMHNASHLAKIHFYKAMIETCEAAIAYAHRYADCAEQLAKKEKNAKRKKELLEIARVCRRVPEHPPETLQEALQSVWFAQSLFILEENQTGISLGRADQYLLAYYQNDIQTGRLTEAAAYEMLCLWLIKMSEIMWLCSAESAMYFAGYQPFINLVVGGQKREGGDATNDLTLMLMDCSKALGLYQPGLAVRIHNSSPHILMKKIVEVIKTGMGFPACHFDDAHIKMMLSKGFSFEDARDYCLMGCVEPQKSGRIYQWTSVGYTTWPTAIEMALNNGVYPYDKQKHGSETGQLSSFTNYSQFEQAVKTQVNGLIEKAAEATLMLQCIHRDYAPKPLISALVEGCMESGQNVMDGGAMVNNGPGLIWTGLADYANSMMAIKTLVFDQEKYTLNQMHEALSHNFEGFEQLHQDCLNVAKFGNDIDEVDLLAKDIVSFTERQHTQYRMLYGPFVHGTLSISNNTPFGMMIGALPSGRLSGVPLADGISPSQQSDTHGPTAIINSISKINVEEMSVGQVHNFKLLHGTLNTPAAELGLINLLRSASVHGNAQMQFSYVDNETLLKAQASPEEYRGLMIRVAGYSAFFVELSKEVQDEIISRTVLSSF